MTMEAVNETIQHEYDDSCAAYLVVWQAGGDIGAERDAYHAARRRYNEALANALAKYRAEIRKWNPATT